MRSWMGRTRSLAAVVRIVHDSSDEWLGPFPRFPQSGKGQGPVVAPVDEHRLAALAHRLPFVKPVGHDQAPPPPQGRAKRRLVRRGLRPGIDHAIADGRIVGPTGHEAPVQEDELPMRRGLSRGPCGPPAPAASGAILNRGFNSGTSKSENCSAIMLAGARKVKRPHMRSFQFLLNPTTLAAKFSRPSGFFTNLLRHSGQRSKRSC